MSMINNVATARIIRDLVRSETEIDSALASSASLLATMAKARIDTDAPVATGHVAIMRLVRSLNSLSDARGDLIRVHGELLKVGQERGDYSLDPNGCPNGQVGTPGEGIKLVA
ncbi:MAG: hypothetical protein ACKOQM_02445 [Novosphingobium sp.]